MAPRAATHSAPVRTPGVALALLLLALLLPTGPAFAQTAHHPPSQHAIAALQQAVAAPAATAHAEHPAPPCRRGVTCVQLVPMPAALPSAARPLAVRPSVYPPAAVPAATDLAPSPSPRPAS